ncbi:adenine deaminase [Halarchaeum nitratireducens]|uniref:Adenine deaminase n=1 Tax=Halarchaeum nitratireducens TaxID=489913 RepID=A0A830GDF0_9EURY|nr:adenine deaminase C-terminal domain-containing protein [Halarchaeum nitratireducens]GGN21005.1 adenine deaminase [Halarchaeum nitratireducens]
MSGDADPVDLLVRGTVVNVTTGTLRDGAVAVDDGEIVALAERPAERVVEGAYVAPGLIDAHMHVESSMVTLPRYGEAVVPRGVTSVVHDPHEVANVLGEAGVRGVIADAARTPLKARFTVPSSVPASDLQDGGATLDADAVAELLDAERVVALGEVMNVPGVLNGDAEVHAKIEAARERGLPVDGHAPRLGGDDLHEVARHLDTDHESIALPEAREKARAGLRVYLREGSSSRNLVDLAPLVDAVDARRLSLCTDDREVTDLLAEGGVDNALRELVDCGVDPVTAVQMATCNTADAYDLPFGRIEPGTPADLVVLSDLASWDVEHVVVDGVLDPTADAADPPPTQLAIDTVEFPALDAADLALAHPGEETATVRVVDAVGGLQTGRMTATVPVGSLADADDAESVLHADVSSDVLPLAVIERHGGDGSVGRGFVHGLGLERGAVGSTVAHDAHNCVVAGASHDAMARVANHLREVGGGVAAYDPESESVESLALPVAGLMSDAPLADVRAGFEAVEAAARDLGLRGEAGLMELSFLALEVIPEYRLTNNGLVDVEAFDYVNVVVD